MDDDYTTPTNGDGVGWIRVDFLECCGTEGIDGGDSGGAVTYRSITTTAVATVANSGGTGATYGSRYGYFPLVRDIPGHYGNYAVMVKPVWPTYANSFIAGLYQTTLQRQPATADVDYWSSTMPTNGVCMADAKNRAEIFLKGAELKNNPDLALTSLTNAQQRLRRLYWSVFNRAPDASGLDYWDDQLVSGGEGTWDWLVSHFLYNVTAESNPRMTSVVNQERGPCSS